MPELFRAENLPILQNITYSTKEASLQCTKGDVVLVQDASTGLVSNIAFNPDLLVYNQDYQNEQAHSSIFRKHLDDVAKIIERYSENKTLLEVGCGKAYFLEMLRSRGHRIIGVDPSYEGDTANIIPKPFNPDLGVHADVLILRHVLEHIQSPLTFLEQIYHGNREQGLIYIEVPCFDWIIKNHAWFDIFYEHVNYFRLNDFYQIFETVLESGYLFGGQYIYVVADLKSLREPNFRSVDAIEFPSDFLKPIQHAWLWFHEAAQKKRKCIVWGASSKGVIFSIYMQRYGAFPDSIIDINPIKQGRYLPGSGLFVDSPESGLKSTEKSDIIIIMNNNYLKEIVGQTQNNFDYKVLTHESI